MPDTLPPLRYAATSVAGYWVKRIEPGLTLELSKPLKYTSAAVASSEVAPKKLSTSVVSANALTTPIGTRVFLVSTRPIRSRALPPAARTPGVTETNCLAGIVDMEPSLCCWIFLVYIDQADDHRICKLLRNLYHHIRLKHSLHDAPPFVLLLGVQKARLSGGCTGCALSPATLSLGLGTSSGPVTFAGCSTLSGPPESISLPTLWPGETI